LDTTDFTKLATARGMIGASALHAAIAGVK
jgi:hypothetical protein